MQAAQQPPESAEDARLHSELRAKVNELFGGSENVTIRVDGGDRAEFTVRTAPDGGEMQSYRHALVTVASIAAMSAIAGVLFMYLFSTGAVHGSPQPQKRYEMPTYSTRSYIDPYELLQQESENMSK